MVMRPQRRSSGIGLVDDHDARPRRGNLGERRELRERPRGAPRAQGPIGERERVVELEIAADDEHGVVGPVETLVEPRDAVAAERRQRRDGPGQRVAVRRAGVRDALRDQARERAWVRVGEAQIGDRLRSHAVDLVRRERRLPHDLVEQRERGGKSGRRRAHAHDRRVVARRGVEPRAQRVGGGGQLDRAARRRSLRQQRRDERREAGFVLALRGRAAAHHQLGRDQRQVALRERDDMQAVVEHALDRRRQRRVARRPRGGNGRRAHCGRYSTAVRFSGRKYVRATRCTSSAPTAR
jgi:hypothetical protein